MGQIKPEPTWTENIKPDPFLQRGVRVPATEQITNMRQIKTETTWIENIKLDPFLQRGVRVPATEQITNIRQIKTEPTWTENLKPDPFLQRDVRVPGTAQMRQMKTVPTWSENIKPDPICNVELFSGAFNRPASPPARRYPILPLPQAPKCPACGITSRNRKNIIARNPNGNFGRPYYFCNPCEVTRGWVWITWDDWRGIYADNPECDCGLVSRRDRAGAKSASKGCEFLTCAVGRCGYWESVEIEDQILENDKQTEEGSTVRVKIKVE